MGMTVLKIYWNFQSRCFYLRDKLIHNLTNKQCESSYLFLLACKINMDVNKSGENVVDDDCYVVYDSDPNRGNNQNVPTTDHELAASSSVCNNSSCSSSSSTVPSVRCAQGIQQQRTTKESTGSSLTPTVANSNFSNPPQQVLNLNPFTINNFFNYQSFFQSRGLSVLNIPPNYHDQRSNIAIQRFRNESLFSESSTVSSKGQQFQRERESKFELCRKEDKANITQIRKWIPVGNPTPDPGIHFTLMSYNVLAQDLMVEHSYLYRTHKPRALLWETRWKNIYEEILETEPEILCLQEVQEDHLKDYYHQFLNKGYAHIFKRKTGYRSDGCAIYYKKAIFRLIENTTVEYNQNYPVLDRDNVAIIAKFAPVDNLKAEFVVATTHLLYNPKREDVRLAQTQVLLSEIDRIAYKYKTEGNKKYTPIIITGDFNTEPQSAVYRLVVNGRLHYDNLTNRTLRETNSTESLEGKLLIPPILRITDNCQHMDIVERRRSGATLTRDDELKLINLSHHKRPVPKKSLPENETLFSTGVLSHDLNIKSVFLHKTENDTEGTTYQDKWITVDYIFYSGTFNKNLNRVNEDKLKLIARYSIPTTAEYKSKIRKVPNCALGSDHLALMAKFKLEY